LEKLRAKPRKQTEITQAMTMNRTYLFLGLMLLGLYSPLGSSAQQPAKAPAQTDSPQAELAAAIKQVEKIINQPPTAHMRTPDMKVGTYPGWFHPGAAKPAFDTVDVRTTRETSYDISPYVCSEINPRLVYVGRELEFNPMTKYFYKDRTVPKKKLTEAEMLEVNRLYRIIGGCERQLAQSGASPTSDNLESTSVIVQVARRVNPYTAGAIILVLVLLLTFISKRRTC
jgi:hypothetical protein